LVVTELDITLDFIGLVMVGLCNLNILVSLSSSEVSEEMGVDHGAPNCRGTVCVCSTLDTFRVGSIRCGIDMSPIERWVVQNVL